MLYYLDTLNETLNKTLTFFQEHNLKEVYSGLSLQELNEFQIISSKIDGHFKEISKYLNSEEEINNAKKSIKSISSDFTVKMKDEVNLEITPEIIKSLESEEQDNNQELKIVIYIS